MSVIDIAAVPGVPETVLTQALLDRLPGNLAPAPWTCSSEALVWTNRGGSAATAALHSVIGGDSGVPAVCGGMVRYTDTPVGSYDEVFGAVGFRRGLGVRGNVAFMAVDSEVSIVGGRTNWAMPKTLASFEGEIASGTTMRAANAVGPSWSVAATPRALGPAIPMFSAAVVLQRFPDGVVRHSKLQMKGRARPALVSVDVESDATLPQWLRPGRHLGAIIESMTFTLGAPYEVR